MKLFKFLTYTRDYVFVSCRENNSKMHFVLCQKKEQKVHVCTGVVKH